MRKIFDLILVSVAIALPTHTFASAAVHKPDHLVYMVFDQMRPDYVDRYNLKNFKSIRAKSENFTNGYVGHLGSVTVVSHAVMSTGLLPKDLPWQDDVMWDVSGALGKKDGAYSTTDLTLDQFFKLLRPLGVNQFLATHIKKLGGDTIAIGEKNYATMVFGGPYADRIITLKKKDGKCLPDGVNLPEYILKADRYTLECSKKYGTEKSAFPLDGNHYFPGDEKNHQGGDVWTADAAIDVMNHENWSGLFLTFGAIDRIGHMTGEEDWAMPRSYETPINLKSACEIADEQLGRIISELKKKSLYDRTLIVITADHGGQTDTHYFGNGTGETMGHFENDTPAEPPYWAKYLNETKLIKIGAWDTAMKLWLNEPTKDNIKKVADRAKEVSGAIYVYIYDRKNKKYSTEYIDVSREPRGTQIWASQHNDELMSSMASENSPDVVVLFADNVGMDRIGDHGGAQEKVQRIPMMIVDPTKSGRKNLKPTRLVDLKPLIIEKLGI